MKLKIEINMDNAAFDPCNGFEAARIIRRLADRIEEDNLPVGYEVRLLDLNGNAVGKVKVTR